MHSVAYEEIAECFDSRMMDVEGVGHMNEATSVSFAQRPTSLPVGLQVSLRGFEDEQSARIFGSATGAIITDISRIINLAALDGVTVAYDYGEALSKLERGFQATSKLVPCSTLALGVAMAPAVLRNGLVKSHIVLNANYVRALELAKGEDYESALHILAHECAHVEAKQAFDSCFPGILLRWKHETVVEACRWSIIDGCWDEYAATWICAGIGRDPTHDYERTFLLALDKAKPTASQFIAEYRHQRDLERVVRETYATFGDLMRYACYQLGNMFGRGLTLEALPATKSALSGHWFAPHWDSLSFACAEIARDYGRWETLRPFERIGEIADHVLASGGVFVSALGGAGQYRIDIP